MIGLLLTLAILGLFAYLLTTYIPMPEGMKTIIIVVVILLAILIVLNALGIDVAVPKLKFS